jgi:hypothetical protein
MERWHCRSCAEVSEGIRALRIHEGAIEVVKLLIGGRVLDGKP